ncbi:hypothetical protein [Amycolatopsis sp. NPDC052450]|uniref:hypothetical protein n=1 Tax=Amycolatopsis sp. NPDC052450 TaxID=3363937 RepID=UPI0037C9CA31
MSTAAIGDQRASTHSHDLTGDGIPDLLSRQPGVNGGSLWVYPGSGKLQEMATFTARTEVRRDFNGYNWVGVAEMTGETEEYETVSAQPADLVARRATDGALFVFPHSGKLNGLSTFGSPVQIGRGWNSQGWITLADVTADGFDDVVTIDGQDIRWVYPHKGTFDGQSTLKARVKLGVGRSLWELRPSWSRENPDSAAASVATGDLYACPHTNTFDGEATYKGNCKTVAPVNTFAQPTTSWISLIDADGDGNEDVLKREPDGDLFLYRFNGWNSNPMLAAPVQVGRGWNSMDLIT